MGPDPVPINQTACSGQDQDPSNETIVETLWGDFWGKKGKTKKYSPVSTEAILQCTATHEAPTDKPIHVSQLSQNRQGSPLSRLPVSTVTEGTYCTYDKN